MRKAAIILGLILGMQSICLGQTRIADDFSHACDTLATLLKDRCGVEGELKLKAVMKRGSSLDFYFTESLGDFPWYRNDPKWFRNALKSVFPEDYRKYRVGEIYSRRVNIDNLVMPGLHSSGKPSSSRHRVTPPSDTRPIVTEAGRMKHSKGLHGRHIALWQSHGRYYEQSSERWEWQRPCLFRTCEDMFTQGFVLPYLVPMLENAGAYVLLPRERDIQRNEIIADNDSTSGWRGYSAYDEKGTWSDAGEGFGDTKAVYEDLENPFVMGSARKALCVGAGTRPTATVTWTPSIPQRGEYAVYISYKSLPNSSTAAHYTVRHLGGTSEFEVNQKMGGGTWIYLGTFEFGEGMDGYVTLDNTTPKGHIMEVGATVTADAIRFGGGMGNIARRGWQDPQDSTAIAVEPSVSGMPRSAEAARYWLQWAGADSTVYYQNEGKNDYKDDFMSRGDWVEWISRGSKMNPGKEGGLGIPIDLSFGFHSDAGVTANDSLVGTLAIYTYRSEGKTALPSKEDRLTSRMFADMVQSQIVSDLRAKHDSLWIRRSIWDRAYRESRTPSSPAMLLELLSHQNFADMKYGLDPTFRFDVSRAVYKGMLKYLSNRYGQEYVVQPLPVDHIAADFESGNRVAISWKAVDDPLEPTAAPTGYIVYRRIGDGAFDCGTRVTEAEADGEGYIRWTTDIPSGEVASFKVAAYNDGGLGFPSETVSIGLPLQSKDSLGSKVLIVNNFDRISGPAYFDMEERAGFDDRMDSGVPHIRDITFVGEMYNFRRCDEWISNDRPGFGASYTDMAGEIIAGNTFDYPSVHGKAILKAGYAFTSCSNERFCCDTSFRSGVWTLDLICGKQVTTKTGNNQKYTVFTSEMQAALKEVAAKGGNILVSGAYIGTDLADSIYPDIRTDSTSVDFAKNVLGYRFITNQASRKGKVLPVANREIQRHGSLDFATEMNPDIYCVESPDGIAPAGVCGKTIYRYADSGVSAGVAHKGEGYRCVSLGFPIETLNDPAQIENIIITIFEYFRQ